MQTVPLWRNRLSGADPGGYSLRIALRASLSLAAAAALLLSAGERLHLPATVALLGAQVAMMSSAGVSDPERGAQRVTFLLAIAAAVAAVVLAAFLSASPWLAGIGFCVLTFVTVYARALGPRGMAVGLLAFLAYFSAMFVGATPATMPPLAAAIAVGGAIAYAVHFWVVRERSARVRERVLDSFRARIQLLLRDLAAHAESGAGSERRWRGIRRAGGLVGEVALALDDAVARSEGDATPEVREWLASLLHAQLAVDMLSESVHRLATGAPPELRQQLAATVRSLEPWIDLGDPAARAEALRRVELARTAAGDAAVSDAQRAAWWRLQRAMDTLTSARPWARLPALDAASQVAISSFRPGGGGGAGVPGMSSDLRLAIQATVAVALSIVAGRAISPTRWYWAVLAAFVVFIRATTLGETMSRAWQRILGTVLGVMVGLGVATVVGHRAALAGAIGLGAVFLAYYLMRISYTGMIACFTIALSLLYEEMGRPLPGLMELRVAETLVGAVIGVLVSALVLPAHSESRVRLLAAGVARAATGAIARATTPGVQPGLDMALHEEIRRVDRALAEMRNALRPLWGPNVPVERSVVTRQGRLAAALAYTTRRFATTPLAERPGDATLVQRIGAQLASNCESLAAALEQNRPPVLVTVEPLVAQLAGGDGRQPSPGGVLLAEVDAMVSRLATVVGVRE